MSVDTTVMEKNIAHPTDARLYEKARQKLVALAAEAAARAGAARVCTATRPAPRRCARSYAPPRTWASAT